MDWEKRAALKDILCYSTNCDDCPFRGNGCNCDWENAKVETLVRLAKKNIEDASPDVREMLIDYAKRTSVYQIVAPKAKII